MTQSKQKLKVLIILFLLILSTSGCNLKSYSLEFNSSSNSDCLLQCEKIMKNHTCFEAIPSYQSQFINGDKTKGVCDCYIRECFK